MTPRTFWRVLLLFCFYFPPLAAAFGNLHNQMKTFAIIRMPNNLFLGRLTPVSHVLSTSTSSLVGTGWESSAAFTCAIQLGDCCHSMFPALRWGSRLAVSAVCTVPACLQHLLLQPPLPLRCFTPSWGLRATPTLVPDQLPCWILRRNP